MYIEWDDNDIPHIMIHRRGTFVPLHQLVYEEVCREALRDVPAVSALDPHHQRGEAVQTRV